MAVEFDLEKFTKQMETRNIDESTEQKLVSFKETGVEEKSEKDSHDIFTQKNYRENKKRYNFTIKPSTKNILKIEAIKRNTSQSELIEILIENIFGANDENN